MQPTCSCLVLCDDVVVSHAFGKHQLSGIIGAMNVPFVPHPVPGGVVYVRVSNVHGNEQLTVRLVRADNDHEPIWEIQAEIVNRNEPLDVHTLVARVPAFEVQSAGRYLLEARHMGVPICTVPIQVNTMGLAPGAG